jgi:hypothetical protein
MVNVSTVEIPLMFENTTKNIYEGLPWNIPFSCVVRIGLAMVSMMSTNLILLTGRSLHQMSNSNEVSTKISCLLQSIPLSLGD